MPAYYDFCILGAGLAGLSLADVLQAKRQKVVVVEKNEIGSGASGTPGGLVNPATGRKGKKSWKAEECFKAVHKNLEKIQKATPIPFFHQNGVLRPAQTEKMGQKMKLQFDQTSWPNGWCYWLSKDEIKQKHPGIHCIGGGLWLPKAMTVNGKKYVEVYARRLQSKNVEVKTKCEAGVEQKKNEWRLQLKKSKIKCKNLIYATGFETVSNSFWKDLKLEAIKGQVGQFGSNEKLPFTHSVSGLGYLARLQNEYECIMGSTYEHNFEDLRTDDEAAKYLQKRLKKMLPQLAEKMKLLDRWAGVRVSARNRKPVAGEHPNYKNLFLFTGLGSKGLLYSKFTAEHFADHLLNNNPLFAEIAIDRMLN